MRSIIVALALAVPVAAAADPAPVDVQARLDGTVVRLTARYRITVDGPQHGADNATLELPTRASVVRATATVDGAIHPLDLIPAETATARYDATGARPVGPARRWAVLVAVNGAQASVSITAARKVDVALELELQQPTCFFRDARYAAVPESWRTALAASVPVPAHTAELAEECGKDGVWIAYADRAAASRSSGDRLVATSGRATLEDGTHFARVELAAGAALADIPRDLATAILVDGSRSLTPAQADAQRELVDAYLRGAPDARVQVIAYARRARALLPGWELARSARIRVDRELRALAPRNGSNIDAGLAEAAAWLARTSGTRRVVVITDELLAQRFGSAPSDALAYVLPRGTLVHVVAVRGGTEALARDDDAQLAGLALASGGIAVATGFPATGFDATMLLRPIALDNFVVEAPGWTPVDSFPGCAETLVEGRACTWWGRADAGATAAITVRGFAWSKLVSRTIVPDPAHGLDVVRELDAEPPGGDFADRIALAARAANSARSLYIEWGGNDGYGGETTSGFDTSGSGTGTIGTSGFGSRGGVGHGQPMPHLDLRAQLEPAVARCFAGPPDAEIAVETTRSEIVDVKVTLHVRDPGLQACVEDAVWDTAVTVPAILRSATQTLVFPSPRS